MIAAALNIGIIVESRKILYHKIIFLLLFICLSMIGGSVLSHLREQQQPQQDLINKIGRLWQMQQVVITETIISR